MLIMSQVAHESFSEFVDWVQGPQVRKSAKLIGLLGELQPQERWVGG